MGKKKAQTCFQLLEFSLITDMRNITSTLKSLGFEKYFSSITMHRNWGEISFGRKEFIFRKNSVSGKVLIFFLLLSLFG